MIAMFIATIVMLSIVATFGSVIKTRNNIKISQRGMEDGRTAMDLMAKTLRMATDVTPGSKPFNDGVYNQISFYNTSTGQCTAYRKDGNGIIQVAFTTPPTSNTDLSTMCDSGVTYTYSALTSASVDSSNGLQFNIVKTSTTPSYALGKVTILMVINGKPLQTTVSFRDYSNL